MDYSDKIKHEDIILVTGASGYIAAHIVKLLLDRGYRVRGTVRNLKDEAKVASLKKLSPKAETNLEFCEADLNNEESWLSAVKGCKYVIHTASPYPSQVPKNEDQVIKPAVNGTLYVLRACVQKDSIVQRVVLTSSAMAIFGDRFIENHNYTENDWPTSEGILPYAKSKFLAEKAAWNFVDERKKNNQPCFELAVINPGMVLGPTLHDSQFTSIEVIKFLMTNGSQFLPNITFPVCDVRDVALAHLQALLVDDANHNRHIIASRKEAVHFKELALILDAEFKSKNYKIPTKIAPNFLIKFLAIFYKPLQQLTTNLGRNAYFDNTRLTNVLGIKPIKLKDTVIDMANCLIEKKLIPDLSNNAYF